MSGALPESEDLTAAWAAAEKYATERGGGEPEPAAPAEQPRNGKGQFAKGDSNGETSKADGASAPVARDAVPAPVPRAGSEKPGATRSDDAGGTDSLAALRELAQKHGFTVEDGKVLPRERHAFREERRQARAQLAAARAQLENDVGLTRQQIQQQGRAILDAKARLDASDFDGFAQALGHKDWNELNSRVINQFADPNYKKLQELERRELERQEQAQRYREQQTRVQAAQEEARAQSQYKASLSEQMASSADPFVAAMHDDPAFVNAVFALQQEHWDGYETISVEEAVRLKPRNGGSPLLDELRGLYNRLDKAGVFRAESGPPDAQRQESPQKGEGRRDAQKPARNGSTTISQKDAREASPRLQTDDDAEFLRYATARLNEAAAQEAEAKKNRKSGAS